MKIVLGYPSLEDPRGFIQVGQNRQSKIFSVGEEAAIFPCVMAWAATMLKRAGHEVVWQDGPTEGLSWAHQFRRLQEARPDLVCWEVKTPSALRAYAAVTTLKQALPGTIVVLVGDHVTALPEEALIACPVDFVVTGGDYDFAVAHLVKQLAAGYWPERWTNDGPWQNPHRGIIHWPTDAKLETLPTIDRVLCHWKDYSRMGNYLYRPGTHGYSARDCWWRSGGGCTFCSWTNTFKNYRQLSVDQFMADVESAHALGAREYFDDAGTWAPPGPWAAEGLRRLRHFNLGYRHQRARMAMGCNDRPGARGAKAYREMAGAGFRFILYGLESANLDTLQRINKGQKAEDMRNAAKWASEAGLQPHLTTMFGYSHESLADAENTIVLIRELFDKGWANSMQATLLMPYPGTRLFKDCDEQGLLRTKDWSLYTMNQPVIKCPMTDGQVLGCIRRAYKAAATPKYVLRKIITIRTKDDFRFLWRGLRFWAGHLKDFSTRALTHPH